MKQYFHGDFQKVHLTLNAFVLCLNFTLFCPRTLDKNKQSGKYNFKSRAEVINGKKFDENWLLNLLSSNSCNSLAFSTK